MSSLMWGVPATTYASSPPVIESSSVSHVTEHAATLEAKINPEGSATGYEIWFWPGCSGGACERGAPYVVAKAADIGDGYEGLVVDANLTELEPGLSNNEYWVVASNSIDTVESAHQSFATPPQPRIEGESVSHVTSNDATLEAEINPEGLPQGADYEFQVVKNSNEYLPELVCAERGVVQPVGHDGCLDPAGWPSGAIPLRSVSGGAEGKPVSLDLASVGVTLEPGTIYHYRVLAAASLDGEDTVGWEPPAVIGADQMFTTPEDVLQPVNTTITPGPALTTTPAENTGQSTITPAAIAPANTVTPPPRARTLTNAQKFAKALRLCAKKPKKRRASCRKLAHKNYGQIRKEK
jgi:hypothetical protein